MLIDLIIHFFSFKLIALDYLYVIFDIESVAVVAVRQPKAVMLGGRWGRTSRKIEGGRIVISRSHVLTVIDIIDAAIVVVSGAILGHLR